MNTKKLWLTILVVLSLGLSMSVATADGSADTGDIVINEFVSDNATEWVELYNNGTESVNLTNWTLEDGAGTTKSISGTIFADGYLIFNCGSGWLNNGGDIIYLNNTTANIDKVAYGNWDDGNAADNAPAPDAGESAGRYPNGVDTDVDVDDFQVFDNPTPEMVNEVPGTVSISDGGADAGATTTVTITADAVVDLANFDMTITYDSTVVTVTAADNGGFGDMNNLENAANGTVNLLSFSTGSGQTGDGVLLSTLTLEAVGTATAGQTSALTLTINELLDSAEAAIDATTDDGLFTVNESATLPLTVIADPTNVTENTATEVTFTVTSDDSAVDGALVTLLGCGVDVNGTTVADGTVIISVTATDVGAIDVTTTKDGYDDATTSLDVLSGDIPPVILSATLSPNAILSNGADSTTLTVQASSSIGIASVTVDLSAIGGPDKQSLAGTQMGGTGTWTTTFNATSDGTFDLTVTVTDDNDNLATADVTLTAGPYKYTLELKQGWNMISLPYNIAAVGIDTTQKLGDLITNAGVPCYYVAWFNATSQMMEPDLIGEPDDTTYPIVGGQAYFVFVGTGNDVAVVGTLW